MNILRNTKTDRPSCDDNKNCPVDPYFKSHIILLYQDQFDLDKAIIIYLNEGLKKDQSAFMHQQSYKKRLQR